MLSQENQARCHESKRLDDFNALAFEAQRYEVFQQTETPVLSESYLDGNWDAVIGCEPSSDRWYDSFYRQGYSNCCSIQDLEYLNQKYDLA